MDPIADLEESKAGFMKSIIRQRPASSDNLEVLEIGPDFVIAATLDGKIFRHHGTRFQAGFLVTCSTPEPDFLLGKNQSVIPPKGSPFWDKVKL